MAWFLNFMRWRIGLKSPAWPALYTERHRSGCRVVPLIAGWRITIRKRA